MFKYLTKNNKLTYISLFSSAGIGCYGFQLEKFNCIATCELIEKRINIQKVNNKCKYDSGYVCGDITKPEVFNKINDEIKLWKNKENIKDVDVVIATPPCQGMSVANQKKQNEIRRNSLVVKAIDAVDNIKPKIFVFENVQAFLKTYCTDINGRLILIGDQINKILGSNYSIYSKVINFKNYGSNSSRQRTLVIGVRNNCLNIISPFEIFPDFKKSKTLKQVIGHYKKLSIMGEYDKNNPYHSFKKYDVSMRPWIHNLKQGVSAFENKDPHKRPHKIINGKIVEHKSGFGDKYKRQTWNKVAPCIHTANDCLASQNTIHPIDDRVFSIAELMDLMTIPHSFKWFQQFSEYKNHKILFDKICDNELNIRKCIGEAVPTKIFQIIAKNIRSCLCNNKNYLNLAIEHEKTKNNKKITGSYYTNRFNLNYVFTKLPDFSKKEINILEPSVGSGAFLPILLKKYNVEKYDKINLFINDVDKDAIKFIKKHIPLLKFNKNKIKIFYSNSDYLKKKFKIKFDLIVGNPPFFQTKNKNIVELFWGKALNESNKVIFISPKFLIFSPKYVEFRKNMIKHNIISITDFGEYGFKDAKIETIFIVVDNSLKFSKTVEVASLPKRKILIQDKNYIFNNKLNYWLIYRNNNFDNVYNKMITNVFNFIRFSDFNKINDSKNIKQKIWLLRSKNISTIKPDLIHIKKYDRYVSKASIITSKLYRWFKKCCLEYVYLTPTLTYYPRLIKTKVKDILSFKYVFNGSIFVVVPKQKIEITRKDLNYFYSDEFREFYSVACNYCTRTLNIDDNTIKLFGIRR